MATSRGSVGQHRCAAAVMLAVIETHPVQYHAPVYRAVRERFKIPVTAIYGSDFSVAGYIDPEFGARFSWDTSLLDGYRSIFLSEVKEGGARDATEVSTRGLSKILHDMKPSALLLVGYSPAFNRSACFVGMRSGVPLLFRGETTDHAVPRGRLKSFARDTALQTFYRRFARLLYVGQRSAQHFERLGFARSSLIFSPYCVNISAFECDESARERLRDPMRQRLGIRPGDFVVMFSGKLSARKGPDLLMHALKQLPANVRDRAFWIIVGDGELRTELEEAVAGEPRVRVHFAGFKNQGELSPYFHASDVLVLPSRHGETWGLVVNEALHHGVPVIASDAVGCSPDLIESGKTGLTFAAGRVDGLARGIVELFGRGNDSQVRAVCRSKVADYSIAHAAEGIARAYAETTGLGVS
jgi:glycosyltransferase involved in cell wall biosynthesis